MTQLTEQDATAAETGASATKLFQSKQQGLSVSPERVAALAGELLAGVHEVIRRNQVSYAEYDALKAWLIRVGQDGEWPLLLDVFLEHEIEAVANASRLGSKCSIEGPFYVPDAPRLSAEATLPMRPDETGEPMLFHGQVRAVDGTPLAGAQLEIWHADSAGFYSQFAPALPEWNLRGTVIADQQGRFAVNTILPAPYQIPHDGATGALITAAGWHAWRPAHLHIKVSAPGHQLITSQLYFRGGDYLGSDVASAVKPELILEPEPASGGGCQVGYDFVLDPA
ncbi:MAG TPA: catechol 1,2-dioxygenase [Pseudonocardia sp.]|jgi:catechol 1,2-dioxygenase